MMEVLCETPAEKYLISAAKRYEKSNNSAKGN